MAGGARSSVAMLCTSTCSPAPLFRGSRTRSQRRQSPLRFWSYILVMRGMLLLSAIDWSLLPFTSRSKSQRPKPSLGHAPKTDSRRRVWPAGCRRSRASSQARPQCGQYGRPPSSLASISDGFPGGCGESSAGFRHRAGTCARRSSPAHCRALVPGHRGDTGGGDVAIFGRTPDGRHATGRDPRHTAAPSAGRKFVSFDAATNLCLGRSQGSSRPRPTASPVALQISRCADGRHFNC